MAAGLELDEIIPKKALIQGVTTESFNKLDSENFQSSENGLDAATSNVAPPGNRTFQNFSPFQQGIRRTLKLEWTSRPRLRTDMPHSKF